MVFVLEKNDICEDTFSLLLYYIQNYAVTNSQEKEKMKRVL
jgi:hypothetical protein